MPKTLDVKDLTDHLKNLNRPAYGFFVSQDIWDGMKERIPAAEHSIWGSPIMIDPSLDKERFDIAFSQESFDRRAHEIRAAESRGKGK